MDRRSFLTAIAAAPWLAPAVITRDRHQLVAGAWNLDHWGIRGSNTARQNGKGFGDLEEWLNDPGNVNYAKPVVLNFKADEVYRTDRELRIRRGLVTLELNGATWQSNHRIVFDGSPARRATTGEPARISNCYIRNGIFGTGENEGEVRGPRFDWCVDSEGSNLLKQSPGGTAFNITFSRNVWFRNCVNRFSNPRAIGYLVHMSDDSGLEGCVVKDGPFIFGMQLKGGARNSMLDCTAQNITRNDDRAAIQAAFVIRGDAPYNASNTKEKSPYPYSDLGWDQPDPRRQTRDARVIGCRVINCPTCNAIEVQEQENTTITDFAADGVRNGIRAHRISTALAGQGNGVTVSGVELRNVRGRGVYAGTIREGKGRGDGAPMAGIKLNRVTVFDAGREGVLLDGTVAPQLVAVDARSSETTGIVVSNSNAPVIESSKGVSASGRGVVLKNVTRPSLKSVVGL